MTHIHKCIEIITVAVWW